MLIQTGLYRRMRSPYFLAYFVVFSAVSLYRPSGILFLVIVQAMGAFCALVIHEERHLSVVHGNVCETYRRRTGRYFPRGPARP